MNYERDVAEDEIVIKNLIHCHAIRDAYVDILFDNDDSEKITEQYVLNMINEIYTRPTFPNYNISIEEESAAKRIEVARSSLLKKVENKSPGKFEISRKRVEDFLLVTENSKFQKYKGVLAEVFETIDGKYRNCKF